MTHAHARRDVLGASAAAVAAPVAKMQQGLQGLIGGNGLRGTIQDVTQGRLGGMGQRTQEQAAGSQRGELDWFNLSTFTTTGNTLVQDQEVRIAEFTVPAQTAYAYGFGEPEPGKAENQGTIYFDPQDATPNPLDGWLRLRSENAVGKEQDDHGRIHTSRLRAPAVDRPDVWHKLPERAMEAVGEDSVLYLTFEADNATDAGQAMADANSQLTMAMTEFTQGNLPA